MAGKEAILCLLDVGSSMYDQYAVIPEKIRLDIGIECISIMLQQKILFSKTHEVGLILFGAEEAEDGNNYYIREISKPDFEFIRNVRSLIQHDPPQIVGGDIFHSIDKALNCVDDYVKKRKYEKKIYLITNGNGRTNYTEDDIIKLGQKVKRIDAKINIIAIDFCNNLEAENEDDEDQKDEFKPDPLQSAEQVAPELLQYLNKE